MKNEKNITKNDVENALVNLKQLTLEITDACNLHCKYCGYGDLYFGYDKREDKYLPFEKVKAILDYLAKLWNNHNANSAIKTTYIGFYGGEPLLNINLIKQTVAYAEGLDTSRKFVFAMTTNAMLLDKYMDYIAEKQFNTLISLDGNREGQSYRVNHNGQNSFDQVYKNIKLLQQKYPKYFEEYVNFNSVLHNHNSVESIYNFIQNEFGKTPTISELNNSGIRSDKIDEFNRTYRNKEQSLHTSENYEKLSEKLFVGDGHTQSSLLFLHQYSGNTFQNYNDLFVDETSLSYRPTGTCTPFAKKLFLTVNGKIIQCERIHQTFALGNIDDSNNVNLDISYIVDRFNAYLAKFAKQCDKCYRQKSCTQCMYYVENIDDKHPVCHGFMNKEYFEKYKNQCLGYLYKHPYLYKKLMTEVLVE